MTRTVLCHQSPSEFNGHPYDINCFGQAPFRTIHVPENDQIITSRFDGMSVKVAFSTSCCCTSLQNVNTNLSLSLNVTAQSDIFWHGTQCEALVGMAVNVHHMRC